MEASKVKLSRPLEIALVAIGNGAMPHRRYVHRLIKLGLVQRELFADRVSLTADGRAQLGISDGQV